MGEKLELALLGTPVIRQGGELQNDFKSSKAQALLCYLAVTSHTHTRPALAGLLWGDMPEHNARMNLSQALTKLRKSFGDNLSITRQMVGLNRDSDYWLDVEAFESATARENLEALDKAVKLYRGDFLDGLYVRDAPEFEIWVLTQRARLRELALRALHTLAANYARQGESGREAAIDYVKRLLTLEPWQEEAHRQLMRLLALSGRRSSALVQYEKCRQILIDELGVEPAEETTSLYKRIRDEEFVPASVGRKKADLQIVDQPVIGRPQFSTNLPLQATDFVGREHELADLYNLTVIHGTRLVTIVGLGGIGKTRLALEFAERQLPSKSLNTQKEAGQSNPFPNGIFFVSLEALGSGELIVPTIAEAMHYRLDRGEAQLLDYLRTKRLLLVIDNFEHLLEGAHILSRIIKAAPNVHILVTSRERLNLHEEQVYPLQGLEFPDSARARHTADYSAGVLFMQAARRQRPDFTLDDSNVEYLARICQLVEGMPLALELAATWTDTLPLSDIAAEIQQNFEFLGTEFRDVPTRHRSMRTVMDVSWELLPLEEQTTFSRLSVFRGGFTREAATAITDATIKSLATLVGKSLIRYAKSEDRYYVHELLRQYSWEKLAKQKKQVTELYDRHSQYYCEWFANQVATNTLKSTGQKTVLNAMTAELENTLAALHWALQNQQIKRMKSMITAFGMYYVWRGGFQEGERIFRSFTSLLSDVKAPMDANREIIRINLLNWQSYFLSELGNREKAFELVIEIQKLLESPCLAGMDTRTVRAHNLANICRAGWWQSPEVRLKQLSEARALYHEDGHPFDLPNALTASTSLALVAGQLKEAEQSLKESLEIHKSSGNQLGWADTMIGLGNLSFVKNDYAKAELHFLQAVKIASEVKDLQRNTIASIFLGTTYLYSGEFDRAKHILEKCVANSTDLGLQTRCAVSVLYLGYDCLHLGNYDAAAHFGNISLPLAQETNYKEIIAQAIMLPAAIALTNGEFAKALLGFKTAEEALDSRRFTRVLFGEDCGQVGKGASLLQLGRMDEAQTVLTTLLQQAVANHRQDGLLNALVGIALLFARQGDAERAVEIYSLAASQPFVGNSRWFADVFRGQIEAASTSLPGSRFEQARMQGRRRDLWGTANELLLEFRNHNSG